MFSKAVTRSLEAIGRMLGVVPPKPTASEIKALKKQDKRNRKEDLAPLGGPSKEQLLLATMRVESERKKRLSDKREDEELR